MNSSNCVNSSIEQNNNSVFAVSQNGSNITEQNTDLPHHLNFSSTCETQNVEFSDNSPKLGDHCREADDVSNTFADQYAYDNVAFRQLEFKTHSGDCSIQSGQVNVELSIDDTMKRVNKMVDTRESAGASTIQLSDAELKIETEAKLKGPRPLTTTLLVSVTVMNCLAVTLPLGFLSALSVLFVSFIEEFQSTRTTVSAILAVYNGIMCGFGGIVGPLMNRYNNGYICIVAGILSFIGCIIGSVASSIPILMLGIGIFSGVGLSVTFLIPYITVSEIYDKHKVTMLTIVSSCLGFGYIIFPYLTAQLTEWFNWRGTLFIYSGLLLNMIPFGMLNAIVNRRLRRNSKDSPNWKSMFNFSLFRMPRFLVIAFVCFLINLLVPTINMILVDMLRGKGFDIATGAILLSIFGFSNVGGRIILIILTPFLRCNHLILWFVSMIIVAASVMMYAFANTYEYFTAIAVMYGMFFGMVAVAYPIVVMKISGVRMYSTAIGYCNLLMGVGVMIGGPIVGFIKDSTGSYDNVYYLTAAFSLIACSLLGILAIQQYYQERLSEKKIAASTK